MMRRRDGGARAWAVFRCGAPLTDQSLRDELPHRLAREGPVDLELLRDDRRRDQLLLGHVGEHFLVGRLVEEDEVGELLLDLALGPLLRGAKERACVVREREVY